MDTRCCHVRTHPARNFLQLTQKRWSDYGHIIGELENSNFRRTSSALGNLFRCWLAWIYWREILLFPAGLLPNGAPQPAGAGPPPGG